MMDFSVFRELIRQALAEDLGAGDVTTEALVAPEETVRGTIIARQEMVVAGLPLAEMVFRELDPTMRFQRFVEDGSSVISGAPLLELEGAARAILGGERTALNFIQHLSGVATLTSRFSRRAGGKGVVVLDTRKTIPCLRKLQKYAVEKGGGVNHRFGLYDAILVKDNHLKLLSRRGPGAISQAVKLCRGKYPAQAVEVEVENLEQLEEAINAGAEIALLDNFTPQEIREAVELAAGRIRLEASGGITDRDFEEFLTEGLNSISLGCLTHSAPAADVSLDLELDPFD